MEKSLFEQMGGTYMQQGDYMLPNLILPAEEERPIGIWGKRHVRYLKQYHKVRYFNLLTSGELNCYLTDIDEQAEDMFFRLVKQMAEREGVTEQLKAENQMEWVRRMNNIRNIVSVKPPRGLNCGSGHETISQNLKYLSCSPREVFDTLGDGQKWSKVCK